jgi:hypothetical protein
VKGLHLLPHPVHRHLHGPLELPDGTVIEPTGTSFDVLCSTAAMWRSGQIVEEFLFWDNGTFLDQIGLA